MYKPTVNAVITDRELCMANRIRAARSMFSHRATGLLLTASLAVGGSGSWIVTTAVAAEKAAVVKRMPIDPKSTAAVNASIQVLTKEYAAAMKEKIPKLREKSDYFPSPAPPEITPDAVLAAMEKSIGSDRAAEAYVKWQLLSAMPAPFPAEMADRAVLIYARAPVPIAHPGLNHSDLDRELYRAGISKQANEGEINTAYRDAIDRFTNMNRPIIAYRNELFGRLPQGLPAIAGGLVDIETRASRGIPCADFWQPLSGAIRGWATLGANPGQASGVVSELQKLRSMVADSKNLPYGNVAWDNTRKLLSWRPGSVLNPELVDDTITLVKNAAMNPGGGIKFKDGK